MRSSWPWQMPTTRAADGAKDGIAEHEIYGPHPLEPGNRYPLLRDNLRWDQMRQR